MRLLFTLFLFLATFAASASPPDTLVAALGNDVPLHTQVAIALIEGDSITYYGYQHEENGFQPIKNHQALFEIGSITKVMTNHLLAIAVNQRTVALNKPIHKYLGYRLKGKPRITLQQLASHTSGLPRLPENILPSMRQAFDNPYKQYDVELLERYLKKELILEYEPGSQSAYSNLGAGLLGHILSRRMGSSYPDLLRKHLFGPYFMEHSYPSIADAPKDQVVPAQDAMGRPTANWEWQVLAPAGSVVSCVEDMAHYASAYFDSQNEDLTLMQQEIFRMSEQMAIGLGWHLLTRPSRVTYLFHNGGTGGYTSSMFIHPEQKKAVVVLSNLSAMSNYAQKVDMLAVRLIESLMEQ